MRREGVKVIDPPAWVLSCDLEDGQIEEGGFCPHTRTKARSMAHRIETVEVKGSPMEVFVFEPKGAGPHPGMIVCQHIPIGHTGNLDKGLSPEDVDAYDAALTKAGVEHMFHRYDGANHAFQNQFEERYHPQAAEDAWQKVLAFFAAKLKR